MIRKHQNQEIEGKIKTKGHFMSKLHEQQTGSDTPKRISFKSRFIQWLKQLPLDERYLAVKVSATGLAKKIQDSLIDLEGQAVQSRKDQPMNKRVSPRHTKQIIESIVLISDGEEYFGNVGFDFSYIQHPDKLYQLLTLTLSQQQKSPYLTQHYQIQSYQLKQIIMAVENCQSKQQLVLILISFLRSEIFLTFEEKRAVNLEEQRNRKKQFSMFWRNLSEQYKRRILLLSKNDTVLLSTHLAQRKIHLTVQDLDKEIGQLMQMQKNEFCNKIFKCKLKKSLTYFTDYHEMIYKLWKVQLNKKKKRARNHKNNMENMLSLSRNGNVANQKVEKHGYCKNEKEQEKTEFIAHKDKVKHNNQLQNGQNQKVQKGTIQQSNQAQMQKPAKLINQPQIIQPSTQNQKPHKSMHPSPNPNLLSIPQSTQPATTQKRKRNRNNRRKKSVSAQSKQTNTTSHRFQQQEKQIQERKIEEETSFCSKEVIQTLPSEVILPQPFVKLIQQQHVNCSVQPLLQPHQLLVNPNSVLEEHNISLPQVDFRLQISEKIRADIQQYSDLINQQANQFYERRVMAYQRVQFILGMWKIPIKLFGSCASGITIKNSDIDIAVDNSILNYFLHLTESNRLKGALEQLEQLLQQQPWVTGMRLIKTAAIPLIKLKVNTAVNFVQIPGFDIYPGYLQALNRDHTSAGEIHIDLTIQTINKQLQCNHLGIISTDQVNSWLKSIKSLHSIVIIIKNYLTRTNLNSTYEGGLNTYSMMCMLVAFIKHNHLEDEEDVVKVLEMLAKFYAFQFDEKVQGIDLLDQQDIFYDKLNLKVVKSQTGSQEESKLPELTQSKSATVFCRADLEIKDPLNNGKIMTKNCYSFQKIKQVFQQIYQTCFVEQQNALQTMFKDQFNAKYSQSTSTLKENSKEVRQLLSECKNRLSNPFLTLFE